ncbi:unnamed protein product [Prunus brigantina]
MHVIRYGISIGGTPLLEVSLGHSTIQISHKYLFVYLRTTPQVQTCFRFCHWCGGGWARLVVIVIDSGVDGGGVVVAITLGCVDGSHRCLWQSPSGTSLFFFLFEVICEYLCTCGLVPRCTRSVVPLMLLLYLMTCMSCWWSLRLTIRLMWTRMIQMLGLSCSVPSISPWASHSPCQSSSLVEKQRAADIPPRSSSRLHQSKDEDRIRKAAPPPSHHDSSVEPQAVKHGVDSPTLTLLEMRMAATKNERKSSSQAKGFSEIQTASPKVDKSNFVGGACVSNLLKVVDETVAEEDDAKNGAADEVAVDLADQAVGVAKQMAIFDEHVVEIGGAMEGVVDQAEAEEVVDQ